MLGSNVNQRNVRTGPAGGSTLLSRQGTGSSTPLPAASASTTTTNEEVMRENDAIVRALIEDVRAFKKVSTEVQEEVKTHNRLLDTLHDVVIKAKNGVKGIMGKLDDVSGISGVKHIWLMILIALAVFIYLYLLLRHRA